MKTWKRRWFILTDNCLYYFEFTAVSRGPLGLPLPPPLPAQLSSQRPLNSRLTQLWIL